MRNTLRWKPGSVFDIMGSRILKEAVRNEEGLIMDKYNEEFWCALDELVTK